jgi:hypothetical protein
VAVVVVVNHHLEEEEELFSLPVSVVVVSLPTI